MANKFSIENHVWQSIVKHVNASLPNEACGLIGGKDSLGKIALPIPNMLNSPTEYRMQPEKQLEGFLLLEELIYDLLVIYHSHPNGPPHPSPKDISSHFYPDISSLILFQNQTGWLGRLYSMHSNFFTEIPIEIIKNS